MRGFFFLKIFYLLPLDLFDPAQGRLECNRKARGLGTKKHDKCRVFLVDRIGIEPMTSSMPWKRSYQLS